MLIGKYTWQINNKNFLEPQLRYQDYDLDGSAVKFQRTEFRLNYLYTGANWKLVGTVVANRDEFDNINPLFGKKADADGLGAGFTAGYKNPFGWSKHLSLLGTVGAYENDSDIDFYDLSGSVVSLMALYQF